MFASTSAPFGVTSATAQRRADRHVPVVVVLVASRSPFARRRRTPLSKLPGCTAAIRAGAWPAASRSRICLQRFPLPEIVGGSAHSTFSWAAAWIASYSFGATTPRKSPRRTTCTPGMCLIELSSTERISVARPVAVGALAARPHEPAVQHPGHADVVHVGVRARSPWPGCRSAGTRAIADELVRARRLRRRLARVERRRGHRDVEELVADELRRR